MKKLFKNIFFAIYMIYNLKYLRAFKKGIAKYRDLGDNENERKEIIKALNSWGNNTFNHYDVKIDAEGIEKIPEGPVLFVSNHQGYGDIITYCAAIHGKQFGFVAKKDLAQVPLYGKWIMRIRSIMLEREDSREAVKTFKEGTELLKNGFSLVIFPEGTRSKSDEMAPFKKGSLRLATKTGVPIVPITVSGTWKLYEEKGYVQKGTVRFFVHDPIETKELDKNEINGLNDKVEDIVRSKLKEWNNGDATNK